MKPGSSTILLLSRMQSTDATKRLKYSLSSSSQLHSSSQFHNSQSVFRFLSATYPSTDVCICSINFLKVASSFDRTMCNRGQREYQRKQRSSRLASPTLRDA